MKFICKGKLVNDYNNKRSIIFEFNEVEDDGDMGYLEAYRMNSESLESDEFIDTKEWNPEPNTINEVDIYYHVEGDSFSWFGPCDDFEDYFVVKKRE